MMNKESFYYLCFEIKEWAFAILTLPAVLLMYAVIDPFIDAFFTKSSWYPTWKNFSYRLIDITDDSISSGVLYGFGLSIGTAIYFLIIWACIKIFS